jgi:hypothetical protein
LDQRILCLFTFPGLPSDEHVLSSIYCILLFLDGEATVPGENPLMQRFSERMEAKSVGFEIQHSVFETIETFNKSLFPLLELWCVSRIVPLWADRIGYHHSSTASPSPGGAGQGFCRLRRCWAFFWA